MKVPVHSTAGRRLEIREKSIPVAMIRQKFSFPRGKIDRHFCESRLWWWRWIKFSETAGDYFVEPPEMQRFLPDYFLPMLREHHHAGGMHKVIYWWRSNEMSARHFGFFQAWPGFMDRFAPGERVEKMIKFGPVEIDLWKSDTRNMKVLRDQLARLRVEFNAPNPKPNSGSANRNRKFNAGAFSVIELYDRRYLLGEKKIGNNQWANVRKVIHEISQ